MVERCAWHSLITMHYFTHIYSASLLLGGGESNKQPKQKHALLFLALTPEVNKGHRQKERQIVIISITTESVLLLGERELLFFPPLRGCQNA